MFLEVNWEKPKNNIKVIMGQTKINWYGWQRAKDDCGGLNEIGSYIRMLNP